MVYKIYTNNGERLSLEADYFESDGGGTRLMLNQGGIIAMFYPGEVTRIFPETATVEADVIKN